MDIAFEGLSFWYSKIIRKRMTKQASKALRSWVFTLMHNQNPLHKGSLSFRDCTQKVFRL